MKYRLSRKVRDADVVTLGGKDGCLILRATKDSEAFGVWTEGHNRVTITLKGERIVTPHPKGVVKYGEIEIRSK